MRTNLLFITLVLLTTLQALQAGELSESSDFRIFTDPQGREMEAKLNSVSGSDVLIERSDGLTTKVDIAIFSKEDQKFIREWALKQKIKNDAIEMRFTTDVESKSRWESNGGLMRKTWKESYGIVLKNTTYIDIKNLRVDYIIFKFEDAVASKERKEGEVRRIKGTARVPLIKAGEEIVITTEKFPMLETKLEPNFVWANGGKRTSEDEMRGIWVKVFAGETLATELSRPINLLKKEQWTTNATSSAF